MSYDGQILKKLVYHLKGQCSVFGDYPHENTCKSYCDVDLRWVYYKKVFFFLLVLLKKQWPRICEKLPWKSLEFSDSRSGSHPVSEITKLSSLRVNEVIGMSFAHLHNRERNRQTQAA